MYTKICRYAAVCVALVALATTPGRATAQATTGGSVLVAIPETFPDVDARMILIREPGRDLVVLDPDEATPEALHVGLSMLRKFEERPRPPGRGQMIPVSGFVLDRELPAPYRVRLEAFIERLQRRPAVSLGRLGPGRWMPAQAD